MTTDVQQQQGERGGGTSTSRGRGRVSQRKRHRDNEVATKLEAIKWAHDISTDSAVIKSKASPNCIKEQETRGRGGVPASSVRFISCKQALQGEDTPTTATSTVGIRRKSM